MKFYFIFYTPLKIHSYVSEFIVTVFRKFILKCFCINIIISFVWRNNNKYMLFFDLLFLRLWRKNISSSIQPQLPTDTMVWSLYIVTETSVSGPEANPCGYKSHVSPISVRTNESTTKPYFNISDQLPAAYISKCWYIKVGK